MVDESEKIQLLMKVPKQVKEHAQLEASLAYSYGWISSPMLVQLFIWAVDYYLDTGIRNFIAERRQGKQAEQALNKQEEVENG